LTGVRGSLDRSAPELLPSAAVGSGLVSPWHIAIFVLVVMLVFGPKRLPEMGRMMGKGIREFKDGITHHHEQLDSPPAPETPKALGSPRERDSI
jgi:sec-independent protein translocase protein TatA